jgi:Peptidase family M50
VLNLRKFLCRCFGFLAFVFGLASVGTVASFVLRISKTGLIPHIHNTTLPFALAFSLALLARFVLLAPLGLAVVYGIAWRKLKYGKPAARGWAIAASLVTMLQAILFSALMYYTSTLATHRLPADLFVFNALLLALGIAGLAAFAPRSAVTAAPLATPKPARIAGDGTSAILDQVAIVAAVVGYFACQFLWLRWGRVYHLTFIHGYLFWGMFIAAALVETLCHELGHVSVGLALGMKLRVFIVGPFQWIVRDGKWRFKFILAKFLSAGGAAGVVPTNPSQPRSHRIWMIAAGPLASLVTGLIAVAAVFAVRGTAYEPAWEFLSLMATFGLVSFAVNLIPVRPEALYSDGARIYQLLSSGPWADLDQALAVVMSTTVTALRPRDYDMNAIQRAAISFTHGRQALLLRLLSTSYYLDSGMISQAGDSFAQAEAIYHESASDIPADMHFDFVFDSAYLRRDAAAARQWWDLMQAKKPTHLGVDYWLARSALLWVENHNEEARDAWNKTSALAEQLPSAGAYQFDRYRIGLLGDALNASPATARHAEFQESGLDLSQELAAGAIQSC